MRVRWLRTAIRNLDAEADYIAQDNPAAATEMFHHVMARVDALADFPHAGRPGRVAGTRELVVDRYPLIVPCRILGDEIHVLRVFHTRRQPPKAW